MVKKGPGHLGHGSLKSVISQEWFGGIQLLRQSSTVTVKSPYVITYACQNFGVRNVRGQIPKTDTMRHTLCLTNFIAIFPNLVLI